MKNSSDFVRDIITNKIQKEINPCDNFIPFLVQKYISGISPEHCNLINGILNNRILLWKDSQEIYDFLKCIVPKSSKCYFKYFTSKSDKKESKLDLTELSETLEISKRELKQMISYFPELQKSFTEDKEKILKIKK